MLVVPRLGEDGDRYYLTRMADGFLKAANASHRAEYQEQDSEYKSDSRKMPSSNKITVYTDKLFEPANYVVAEFAKQKLCVRVINEEEMHKSLFISYGGPDEPVAKSINAWLRAQGIKTWFFS